MKKIPFLLLLIILFSCNKETNETIVAKVNNDKLTLSEFKARFSQSYWNRMKDSEKKKYINDWIQLTLFAQEADRLKLSKTPEVKAKLDNAVKNIKSNALLAYKLSQISVAEDDLLTYYKLHKKDFREKVLQYKIQRILVKDPTRLAFIRQELEEKPFSYCAKKYSDESLGKNGGYMGYVSKRDIDKTMWNEVTSLKRNHYKTLKADKGYYIIRWTDKREKFIPKEFSRVKQKIKEIVLQQKREEYINKLLKELKSKSEISIENF
jgi:parvulin-like peptidyl-prolyl isomerase